MNWCSSQVILETPFRRGHSGMTTISLRVPTGQGRGPTGMRPNRLDSNFKRYMLGMMERMFSPCLQFHQTIQTYLNNKVWDFHFYVAKNWPEDPICLHFPGCTSTVSKIRHIIIRFTKAIIFIVVTLCHWKDNVYTKIMNCQEWSSSPVEPGVTTKERWLFSNKNV